MLLFESSLIFSPRVRALWYLLFAVWAHQRGRDWVVPKSVPLNERIVEYPFIHSNLGDVKQGENIIDVGAGASRLPIELASRGFNIWTIDLNPHAFPRKHPCFTPTQGDIRRTGFKDNFFDKVIAVSTVEHIGLEKGERDHEGDKKALREILRIIKPGGEVLVTVPFGRQAIAHLTRIYDLPSLQELFSGFEIKRVEYAMEREGNWVPASVEEVKNIAFSKRCEAVAMVVAKAMK